MTTRTMAAALAVGAVVLGTAPAWAEAMDCVAVSKRQIEGLFDR